METLREVEQVEALAMAELIPEIVLVLETSAKDNTNVEQAFVELGAELKACLKEQLFKLHYFSFMF